MEELCKPYLKEVRLGCLKEVRLGSYSDVYDCYVKPSRYHVRERQAREIREFWNNLSWERLCNRKHEKPEPKKNRPYYRALENKKWRF